jgi:hypothetical protein
VVAFQAQAQRMKRKQEEGAGREKNWVQFLVICAVGPPEEEGEGGQWGGGNY